MKYITIIITVLSFQINSFALSMTDLFEALKKQPVTKVDMLQVKEANVGVKSAKDALYPKIYLIGAYNHYNRPSSLRPVLPTETSALLAEDKPLPFSKDIAKVGFDLNFPVFVKSLYTIREKAKLIKLSSKQKSRLNLLQREAKILGANASLRYLEHLKAALDKKRKSLLKMRKDIALKVANGRAAPVALNKIDQSLNSIDIAENRISLSKNEIISLIETLTGIRVDKSIEFYQAKEIKKDSIFALLPLKNQLKAKKVGLKAAKEALYPTLFLNANYFKSYADGYNNDKSIITGFGTIGLKLVMPLYDRSKYTHIQKARVAYEKSRAVLAKTRDELLSRAKKLGNDMKLLKRSERLTKKSIKNQKELLKVAKVAFKNGRMSEEEYLRYEDELSSLRATLAQTKAKIWQDLAELAVIYGNDLEGVIR